MPYDFERMRWTMRPVGVRWSQMLAGRTASHRQLVETGEIRVSAYRNRYGDTFFTDPVPETSEPGRRVLYRVRVKLKPGVRLAVAAHLCDNTSQNKKGI